MNIQAVDGRWYVNPFWLEHNFRIHVSLFEEDFVLSYKGRVLWTTARRALQKLGIRAKLDMVLADGSFVVGGRLVKDSRFLLKLIRPIPVPETHEGFFDIAPDPLYNGKTLSWKRSGKRWIPIGPTS